MRSASVPCGVNSSSSSPASTGGKVDGFEASLQQSANGLLPSPFDGFGIVANFTYTKSKTSISNTLTGDRVGIEEISKTSYNVIGYYEKYGFSARLAYNYRSAFLSSTTGNGGLPVYTAAFGQLDGQLSYEILPGATILAEARNPTKQPIRQYQLSANMPTNYVQFGRTFTLGAR